VTALVTGAGSGIGAALAAAIAGRGETVVVSDADVDAARRVAAAIGWRATAAELDVTDRERYAALVDELPPIDLLISNAGIAVAGETPDLGAADWDRVLAVNLTGVVHGVQLVYPRMVAARRGRLVNVASVAGLVPYPLAIPYTTSKHAVVGLSLALAAEAAGTGVSVHVACPGMIRTPIWERSEIRGDFDRRRALARVARAMTAETCANKILAGVDRGRALIPITAETRTLWLLQRLSPALSLGLHRAVARLVRARNVAS
jgi:short-subunit dehydrogenase